MPRTIDQIDPTAAELVGRAVALQPLLREQLLTGEIERRLSSQSVEALTAAGLFRLRTPTPFGGYGASARVVLEVTSALGEADGSAAWLVGLSSIAALVCSRASERAQQEVYGTDPDARIGGNFSTVPGLLADGGALVSGRWPYVSGSLDADWALVGVSVAGTASRSSEDYWCLVPATELTLEHTWRTAGMRGTGSNTWFGEDVFAPTHRMISIAGLIDPTTSTTVDEQLHWSTFAPLTTLSLVGPILGMGQAALASTIHASPTKALQQTVYRRQGDSVGVQMQVADAALKLQTARLHACHVADELDVAVMAGRPLDFADRARFKATCGFAVQQVIDAINVLLNAHGSSSFAESNAMQQHWRDANVAARHAGLNAAVGLEVFGKSLLGVPEQVAQMV